MCLNILERPEGFSADVCAGRWDAVLPVLSTLRLPPRVLQSLYEQVVRELVDANEVDAARAVLRGVLPLALLRGEDGEAYARLEALVARGGGGGGGGSGGGSGGGGSGGDAARAAARAAIARSIVEHADTAPPSRLLVLLGQALKWQAHTASLCGGGGGGGGGVSLLGVGGGGGARRGGERPEEGEPARGAPGPVALSYPDAGARPTAAHVTGDGACLVVGGGDGLLEVYSPASGKLRLDLGYQARDEFMLHEAAVTCLASSADGELLGSGAADGRVKVWRLATGECVRRLLDTHGGGPVSALAFSRDGGSVVTGGGDGVARLWGLRSGKCLREFRGHAAFLGSVALLEGEGGAPHTLLTGGGDGRVGLWDVGTGERVGWVAPPPPPGGGEPSVLAALPAPGGGGAGMLVLPRGGAIHWLALSGEVVRTYSIGEGSGAPAEAPPPQRGAPPPPPQPELVAMALSPTGKWLYGGTDGGAVWAWEAATGAVAHRPLPGQRAHRGALVGLAAHPWRALLLSWGTEGDVKSWLP